MSASDVAGDMNPYRVGYCRNAFVADAKEGSSDKTQMYEATLMVFL